LVSVAAGAVLTKIPLRLDQDAPFFLRAIQINDVGLLLRLEDTRDNPLLGLGAAGSGSTGDTVQAPNLWGVTGGAGLVPVESDEWGIQCDAGATFLLYVTNLTGSPIVGQVVTLHGVKRYLGGPCS
jgi:hypothetical protein